MRKSHTGDRLRDKALQRRLSRSVTATARITHVPMRMPDATPAQRRPRRLTVSLAGIALLTSALPTLRVPARDAIADAVASVPFLGRAPLDLDAALQSMPHEAVVAAEASILRIGRIEGRRLHEGACAGMPKHDDPGFGQNSCWLDTLGVRHD